MDNLFTGATNANWGTSTNWSLGVVPTASDGYVTRFDATSPNCSVNSSNRICNHIDFTGYTNTITRSQILTVSGNITLSPTMNWAGTNVFGMNASGTITTNGKSIPNTFQFTNTAVMNVTFADLLTASTINCTNPGVLNFIGSYGFSCSTLNCTVASKSINFTAGVTYDVTSALTLTGSGMSLNSTSTGALLNLHIGATQTVSNCSASWINSSGGQTILPTGTYTLNNTVNWGLPNSTGNMLLMF